LWKAHEKFREWLAARSLDLAAHPSRDAESGSRMLRAPVPDM